MQSLSGSLRQMLLTWLESSALPITVAWKHFISVTHLSSQTPLRKALLFLFWRKETERHQDFQGELGQSNCVTRTGIKICISPTLKH